MPRLPMQRPQRRRVLILVEGDTERLYFDLLKRTLDVAKHSVVDVRKPGPTDALGLLAIAKKEVDRMQRDPLRYDDVWCVFDRDDQQNLHAVFESANLCGVRIAFSSVCFEFWILLHIRFTSKEFQTCREVVAELGPRYQKADPEIIKQMIENIEVACEHARKCRRVMGDGALKPWQTRGYTDVDCLVDTLRSITP